MVFDNYNGSWKKTVFILLVGFIILMTASFIFGGSYKTKALIGEVVGLESELEIKEDALENQKQIINEKQFEIDSYEEKEDEYEIEKSELQNITNDLELENLQLKEAISSSVQAVCCSFDEIQNGVEKNWQISTSGVIICTGELKVDCGTSVADLLE